MDHMCWIPLPHYYISSVLWIICVASPSPLSHLLGVMDRMCCIPLSHYYISWVLWIICVASPSPIITSLGCYGSYVFDPPPPLLHLLGVMDHMCLIPLPHYYISWVLWIICVASPSPLLHLLGVMDHMCCIPPPLLHLLGVMDHMWCIPLPIYISWVLWIICVASPSPIITSLGCYGSYVFDPPPPLLHLLGVMDHMCCIPLPHYYISWVLWIICVCIPLPHYYISWVLWIICVASPSPLLHLLGVMDHMCLIPLPHYYISWVLWIICVASPSPIITSLGCYGSYVFDPPLPLLHLLGVMDHMCLIPLPHYYISWVLWIICV